MVILKKGKKFCINNKCKSQIPINQNICPHCDTNNKQIKQATSITINNVEQIFEKGKMNKKNIKIVKDFLINNLFTNFYYKKSNNNINNIKDIIIPNKELNIISNKYKENNLLKIVFQDYNISLIKYYNINEDKLLIIIGFYKNYCTDVTFNTLLLGSILSNYNTKQEGILSFNIINKKSGNTKLDIFNSNFKNNYILLESEIVSIKNYNNNMFYLILLTKSSIIYIYNIDSKTNIATKYLDILIDNYTFTCFEVIKDNTNLFLLCIGCLSGEIIILSVLRNKTFKILKIYNKNVCFNITNICKLWDNNIIYSTSDGIISFSNIYTSYNYYTFNSFNKPIKSLTKDISNNYFIFIDEFEKNNLSCLLLTEYESEKIKSMKRNIKFKANVIIYKYYSDKDHYIIILENGEFILFEGPVL